MPPSNTRFYSLFVTLLNKHDINCPYPFDTDKEYVDSKIAEFGRYLSYESTHFEKDVRSLWDCRAENLFAEISKLVNKYATEHKLDKFILTTHAYLELALVNPNNILLVGILIKRYESICKLEFTSVEDKF